MTNPAGKWSIQSMYHGSLSKASGTIFCTRVALVQTYIRPLKIPPSSIYKYNRALNLYGFSSVHRFVQLHRACISHDAANADIVAACSTHAKWLQHLPRSRRIILCHARGTLPIPPHHPPRFNQIQGHIKCSFLVLLLRLCFLIYLARSTSPTPKKSLICGAHG